MLGLLFIPSSPRPNRRRFLAGLLATAAAATGPLSWGCARSSARPIASGRRIVVVGAGASGMAAAASLAAEGLAPLVLEARPRVGGRIHSSNVLGSVVDMGASWIHGRDGNPLTAIASRAGVPTFESDLEDWITYDADGTALDDDEVAELEELVEGIARDAARIARRSSADLSVADAFARALTQRRRSLSARARRFLEAHLTGMEVESGADMTRFSMKHGEADETYGGPDLLFPQGFVGVIEHLARGIEVRLGTAVAAIEHGAAGATVVTDAGERIEAEAVIVTLPLGVLKRGAVAFSPGLGATKEEAIGRLGMGVLNKVAMRFPRVFWPRDTQFLEHLSGPAGRAPLDAARCGSCHSLPSLRDSGEWSEFCNMAPVTGAPVLVAFTGGSFGHRIESMSERDVVAQVMTVLRTLFGDGAVLPDAVEISRWHSDPLSGGAYPHVPVGATMRDFATIGQPVGERLFFAGDGTHPRFPGTVHGAVLSGRRAAEEVLERYRA